MSTNAEDPAQDPPVDIYVRPAQLGDICVLLEPTDQDEIRLLRQRQLALQARFGGKPIENVHLTCQRFESQDERSIG